MQINTSSTPNLMHSDAEKLQMQEMVQDYLNH
jgi:hypothetical protein